MSQSGLEPGASGAGGQSSQAGSGGGNPLGGGAGTAGAAAGRAGATNGPGSEFQSLRAAAAAAGKLIGVAVEAPALRSDPSYAEVLSREFDYVTPEDAGKWGPLAPTPDTQTWDDLDAIVALAEEQGQAIKGHTFVWHRQMPTWVNDAMSAEELRAALQSHIEATLARYRGKIRAWDVVNEAVDVNTESGYTDSVFYRTLGPSYIEEAFNFARAADPDVLLFYNEVGIERLGPKADFTYAMLQDLIARGVPIDGIGLQSHVSIHRYPAESDLRANIRRFAELGLRVNISEADARTLLMPGDQASRWQAQRLAFQQIVGACVVEPGCEGVTLWGFTDRYTWINDDGSMDEPLIFDVDYLPKPAYDGVLAGLAGTLPLPGDNVIENGDFAADAAGWSATAGELAVAAAVDRAGLAACVSGRTAETDALAQSGLLPRLQAGGPYAFSAQVRLRGATEGTVNATLSVEVDGQAPSELSLATRNVTDSEWREVAGYVGLGFEGTPTALQLQIQGPGAGVDLCVADVRLQPLAAP